MAGMDSMDSMDGMDSHQDGWTICAMEEAMEEAM